MAAPLTKAQQHLAAKELALKKSAIEHHQQDTAELTQAQKENTHLAAALEKEEEEQAIAIERANEYNFALDQEKIEAQAAAVENQKAPDPYLERLKESSQAQAQDHSTFDFENNTATVKSDRAYKKPKNTAEARTCEMRYQNAFATQSSTSRFLSADTSSSSRVEALPTAVASWVAAPPMAVASRVDELPTALSSPSVVRAAQASQTLSAPAAETLQAQIAHKKISLDPQATSVEVGEHATTVKMANGASVTHQTDPENSDKSIYTVTHLPGLSKETQVINTGVIMGNMMAAEHANQNKPEKTMYVVPKHLAGFFNGKDVAASYSAEDTQTIATTWKLADSHSDKFTVMAGEHVIDQAFLQQHNTLEQLIKLTVTPEVVLAEQSTASPPTTEAVVAADKTAPKVEAAKVPKLEPTLNAAETTESSINVVNEQQKTAVTHNSPVVEAPAGIQASMPESVADLQGASHTENTGEAVETPALTSTTAPVNQAEATVEAKPPSLPQSPVVAAAISKYEVEVSTAVTPSNDTNTSPTMNNP